MSVRTPEAAPLAQDPPVLTAAGAAVIEVHWSPPHKPNGLITNYFIYRYKALTLTCKHLLIPISHLIIIIFYCEYNVDFYSYI